MGTQCWLLVSLGCPYLIPPSLFSNVYCLRLVFPVLAVSLGCPYLFAPSVFSNVYLHHVIVTYYYRLLVTVSHLCNTSTCNIRFPAFYITFDFRYELGLIMILTCLICLLQATSFSNENQRTEIGIRSQYASICTRRFLCFHSILLPTKCFQKLRYPLLGSLLKYL